MPRICTATLSVTDQIPINRMDKLYPVIIHWSSILQKKGATDTTTCINIKDMLEDKTQKMH